MMDYTKLVKSLRYVAENHSTTSPEILTDAADAIEELSNESELYKELTGKGIKCIRDLLNKFPTPPKEEHSPVYESLKRGLEQAINGETREEKWEGWRKEQEETE